MFRSASPAANGFVKLTDLGGSYGADVTTDPNNSSAVWVCTSREDANQCLVGALPDGTYPGLRVAPGMTVNIPGREDNNGLKAVWLACAAAGQWAFSQSY
jgi:hypothetical protein